VPAKKDDADRRVPISCRVLPESKARLEKAAEQHGLPLGELMRIWLARDLQAWEDRQRPARPVPKDDAERKRLRDA
jgi:hypothetical protein